MSDGAEVNRLMGPDEHRSWFAVEAAAFLDVLRIGDLEARVPSCPDWSLRELAIHLGTVHRWAEHKVTSAKRSQTAGPPAERDAICAWYAAGADSLQRALNGISPDAACWTFGASGTAAFWMRRQAHEAAVHRWDAQSSQGEPGGIHAALAADGVHEAVEWFFPRQVRLGRTPPLQSTLGLDIVDEPASGRALVLAGDGLAQPGPPDATVSGPAEALLLLLWKRTTLADPRLSVTGSHTCLREVLSADLLP